MTRARARASVAQGGKLLMRHSVLFALAAFGAAAAPAQEVRRVGAAESPISASVELPHASRLVYVSGTVPDPADPSAPPGSVQRFGDTATRRAPSCAKSPRSLPRTVFRCATS